MTRFCLLLFVFIGIFLESMAGASVVFKGDSVNIESYPGIHDDPLHRFDFRYPDKKRGIRPYIAPFTLLSAGIVIHSVPELKYDFQEWVQSWASYNGSVDDYLQFAPLAGVYALNAAGITGKNNFGNSTAIAIKSILLNDLVVHNLKNWTNTKRPNGESRAFPSGHTSFAFAVAQFMHREFGEKSTWYSVGAYGCATTVGLMRVSKNAHWISDVLAGAGIGMLSTEFIYLTHMYIWDSEHLSRFDIFPFQFGRQKGLSLVINF